MSEVGTITKLQFFIVSAFSKELFRGNPAAVCICPSELPVSIMQKISNELGFSESAFIVQSGESISLRWFSPKSEVENLDI